MRYLSSNNNMYHVLWMSAWGVVKSSDCKKKHVMKFTGSNTLVLLNVVLVNYNYMYN